MITYYNLYWSNPVYKENYFKCMYLCKIPGQPIMIYGVGYNTVYRPLQQLNIADGIQWNGRHNKIASQS